MNTLKRNWMKAGYDQEEAYFFEREQELKGKRKDRPRLELIKGGKSDVSPDVRREGNGDRKKAA